MASFTDAISTFNPYVQQLPVDAMVKVGMYKQQKYDEGVQKIQGYIDNIAGLDVAKGPQKEYLQSKLNQLGSNLKNVAAGDFSNQQLVNSVGGMATQLIKDPIIQNAVSSTQRLRQGQTELEEAKKAGKSDKNNEDKFVDDANKWLNDGSVESSFRGGYTPYTDITKLVKEGLVGAGLDGSIAEQLFITEPGTSKPKMFYKEVINPKTGKVEKIPEGYKYADIKTVEKISSNKEAVYAVLDNVMNRGDVKQQLQIDGWATYRNTDPDLLIDPLKEQHAELDHQYNSKSLQLGALLQATNMSDNERKILEDGSKQLELSKLNSDRQFADLYELSQTNPEAFKQYFYEQNFKNNLKKQFIKEETSLTYDANPAKAQENWQQTYDFNVQKEISDINFKNETLKLSKKDSALEWLKFQADYEQDPVTGAWSKKDAKKKIINPNDFTQFEGNAPGDELNDTGAIVSVQQDIDKLSKDKRDSAFKIYSDFVNQIRNGKGQAVISDEEVLKQINYIVQVGKKKDPALTSDKYLDRWVNDITNKYLENGLDLTPTIREAKDNYFTVSKQLNNKIALDKTAQEVAKQTAKIQKGDDLGLGLEQRLTTPTVYGSPDTGSMILFKDQKDAIERNKIYNKTYNDELRKVVGATDFTGGTLPSSTPEDIRSSAAGVLAYLNAAQGLRSVEGGTVEELKVALANDPAGLTWRAKKPTTTREDWEGEVTITDKKTGKDYTIKNINRPDLETLTSLKFGQFIDAPIKNTIALNKTKTTNPNYSSSPDAWKTTYFKENETDPAIMKAGYVYRADVAEAPGGYRMISYIKPPNSSKFVPIYGEQIVPNEYIVEQAFKAATPAIIKSQYELYLQNKNKK